MEGKNRGVEGFIWKMDNKTCSVHTTADTKKSDVSRTFKDVQYVFQETKLLA